MSKFEEYLEMAKQEAKDKNPITINDINNANKLKDEVLFKSSFGYITEYPGDPGKWIWPKDKKVRWFNADYSETDNSIFKAVYWFPEFEDDNERAEFGVDKEQTFNYQKPLKLIVDNYKKIKGLAPGRNQADKKGKKITWLYNLIKGKKINLSEEKKIQQINYKTKDVTDAVQTFYGSSQELLELLS